MDNSELSNLKVFTINKKWFTLSTKTLPPKSFREVAWKIPLLKEVGV
jgi:hypothetical protein